MALPNTPKTDWDTNDGVQFTDMNEIGENLEHLEDVKAEIGGSPTFSEIGYIFTSGTDPVNSIGSSGSTIQSSYTKGMDVYCPGIGIAQIRFGIFNSLNGQTVFGKIYINGLAVGTERSHNTNTIAYFTENLDVNLGDNVEVWIRKPATGTGVVDDLQIRVSDTTTPKHIISTLFNNLVTESFNS